MLQTFTDPEEYQASARNMTENRATAARGAQDGGMAVRDRMTPSHQSVEHVRRVVREAQHKVVGGPAPLVSDFNEEADDCYMADEHEISVRNPHATGV